MYVTVSQYHDLCVCFGDLHGYPFCSAMVSSTWSSKSFSPGPLVRWSNIYRITNEKLGDANRQRFCWVPSGNLTYSYGTWTICRWFSHKTSIYNEFSIAMLNYQRVSIEILQENQTQYLIIFGIQSWWLPTWHLWNQTQISMANLRYPTDFC